MIFQRQGNCGAEPSRRHRRCLGRRRRRRRRRRHPPTHNTHKTTTTTAAAATLAPPRHTDRIHSQYDYHVRRTNNKSQTRRPRSIKHPLSDVCFIKS
jgi:hypothetical protein